MAKSTAKRPGPGRLSAREVGRKTIASTRLLESRFLMAYAAAVGDPNPAYYDDLREGGPAVHPGICFSLQWNSRFTPDLPAEGRTASFGVHAFTDLVLHQPLKAGAAVTTQGQLLGRRQISPGVYSIDRYSMHDSRGRLLATLDYNSITRGAKLAGPDRVLEESAAAPAARQISSRPLWEKTHQLARCMAHQYTEGADIYNPIHTEPSAALAAGLPDIILHGSATQALAMSDIINHSFAGDPGRVLRFRGQLRAMVLMDTELRVQCLADETEGGERRIFFQVLTRNDEAAVAGGLLIGRS